MSEIIALLIRAGIVLGLIGSVALAGMYAMHESDAGLAAREATDIWHKTHAIYGNSAAGGAESYLGINNAVAIRANIVPSGMTLQDGETIQGPWAGSTVTLSGSSDGHTFYEDWNAIPSSACAEFAVNQPVNYMYINGTSIFINSGNGNQAGAIAGACNTGSNSLSEVKLSFTSVAGQ